MKRLCGIAVLLLLVAHASPAQRLNVHTDARIELFSTLFHLAGASEYNLGRMPAYAATVDSFFAGVRDHPAIVATKRIRGYGNGFFHPMNLAVHLTAPPALAEGIPFDRPGHLLGRRWPADSTRPYLELVRAFYRDARFESFFARRPMADTAVARLRALLEKEIDVGWFTSYTGGNPSVAFHVVPALLNGGAQYGVSFRAPNGHEDAYAVIGIYKTDVLGHARFDDDDVQNVVHEFAHTFVKAHVEANMGPLDSAAKVFWPRIADKMRQAAYGESQTFVHEQVVRALVVRYLAAHRGSEAAAREITTQTDAGFLLTAQLAELFTEYEGNRARYGTLAALMPRIVDVFRRGTSR
jgi:hypothetical protein